MNRTILWAACLGSLVVGAGCHQDMWLQPKALSQTKTQAFSNVSASRAPAQGTVEFGKPMTDDAFYTGRVAGKLVSEFPIPVTEELLRRGKERFMVNCSHCHGAIGDGKGMIAQRGFTLARPVGNYHSDRLRAMPAGHFFDVVTNGYGTMYPLKSKIKPADRWAIAAYIRVLQRSQYTPIGSIPGEEAQRLSAIPYDPSHDAPPQPTIMQPRAPLPVAPTGANQ